VPDYQRTYAPTRIRPKFVQLTFKQTDGGEWEFLRAGISGPRVSVNGHLGDELSEAFYSSVVMPDWVKEILADRLIALEIETVSG
jgi:hypothetical protein